MTSMTEQNIECHVCQAQTAMVTQDTEVSIGSRKVTVSDEFQRCGSCGEEFYLPGQMDATKKRAVARIRDEEGLLQPEAIIAIRHDLDLSQAEFERLLGVGPKTAVRWERGTVFQNKSTDALLRLLQCSRSNAEMLAALHGVTLPAHTPAPMVPESGPTYSDAVPRATIIRGSVRDLWYGRPLIFTLRSDEVENPINTGCP